MLHNTRYHIITRKKLSRLKTQLHLFSSMEEHIQWRFFTISEVHDEKCLELRLLLARDSAHFCLSFLLVVLDWLLRVCANVDNPSCPPKNANTLQLPAVVTLDKSSTSAISRTNDFLLKAAQVLQVITELLNKIHSQKMGKKFRQ